MYKKSATHIKSIVIADLSLIFKAIYAYIELLNFEFSPPNSMNKPNKVPYISKL